MNEFREAFPNAVHLSGYGNTLFGVVMEVADGPRRRSTTSRSATACASTSCGRRTATELAAAAVPRGQTGRVLFHRLDESCLLVGVLERDEAERIPAVAAALALGWRADGLRNPRPPARPEARLRIGLY